MEQDTPVRIVLGGRLGARFGNEWKLFVSSPAEAIRAIDANTRGEFRRFLTEPDEDGFYKVALSREDNVIESTELHNRSGRGDIYILPVIGGRNSVGGKILAGIALIAITYFTAGAGAGAAGFFGSSAGAVTAAGYGLGASLILGGITQMLTPTPSFDQSSTADSKGSSIFQGNSSATFQGGAVPLAYGRVQVSPMPISISFTAVDQSIINSIAPQTYTVTPGPGGIINYVPDPLDPNLNLPQE